MKSIGGGYCAGSNLVHQIMLLECLRIRKIISSHIIQFNFHSLTDAVVDVGWPPIPIDSLLEPDDHSLLCEFQ